MTKLTPEWREILEELWRRAETGEEFAEIARLESELLKENEPCPPSPPQF